MLSRAARCRAAVETCVSDGLVGLMRTGQRNQEELSKGKLVAQGWRHNDTSCSTRIFLRSMDTLFILRNPWASDKKLPQAHKNGTEVLKANITMSKHNIRKGVA